MGDVMRTKGDVREWQGWAGSISEVKRLHERIAQRAQERCRNLVSDQRDLLESEAPKEPVRADFDDFAEYRKVHSDWWDDKHRRNEAQRISKQAESDFRPVVTLMKVDGEEVRGPFDSVIEEFDHRTCASLTISVGRSFDFPEELIRLSFVLSRHSRPLDSDAVKLRVRGSDPDWERLTFSELCREIGLGVPAWTRLLHWGGRWGLYVVTYLASYYGLVSLWQVTGWPLLPTTWQYFIAFFLIPVALAFIVGGWYPTRKLIPPVEITPDGGAPTGSRRIVFAAASFIFPIALAWLAARPGS